ncbi:hypothetical protein AMTRI_Chr10g232810 [Amborella trichopoda]
MIQMEGQRIKARIEEIAERRDKYDIQKKEEATSSKIRFRKFKPYCDHGSTNVLTTQMSNVVSSCQVESRLHDLQPQDSAKNCEDLSLAIVAIGGLISKRAIEVGEWMKVLKGMNWQVANNPSLERVRGILSLSNKDQSPHLIYCFLYSFERNLIGTAGLYFAGQFKACHVHDVVLKLARSISVDEKFGSALTDLNTHWPFFIGFCFIQFEILRVLDWKGIHIDRLPSEIRNLNHLRYLGLRNTAIGCNSESLLHEISCPQHMTYLLVSRLKSPILEAIATPLASSKNIYFELFVSINTSVRGFTCLHALKHSSQLEKLNFQLASMEDRDKLWASIQKMKRLQSLAILSMDQEKPISIKSIPSTAPNLSRLWIHAVLGKLPQWLCSLERLKKLFLVNSIVTTDPLLAYSQLPDLAELLVSKAYNGEYKRYACLLQNLVIAQCKKLKMLGSFIHRTSLYFLHLGDMSDEFITRLRPNAGEDLYKVQQVKQIKVFYVIDAQLGCTHLKCSGFLSLSSFLGAKGCSSKSEIKIQANLAK